MSHSRERVSKSPLLTGAVGHATWTSSLKDFMLMKFQNVNASALSTYDILDAAYFKLHKDFKAQHKTAAEDIDGDECNPFVNDKAYADQCFQHSLATGEGFAKWLPGLFFDIR